MFSNIEMQKQIYFEKMDTFEKELLLERKRQKEAAEKTYAIIMMAIDMNVPKEVKDKIKNLMTEMEQS